MSESCLDTSETVYTFDNIYHGPAVVAMTLSSLVRTAIHTASGVITVYVLFLCLLTIPSLQRHVIYLHKVTLTWFQDITIPEQWGFLPGQVTPFTLATPDDETLQVWHILPLDIYVRHETALTAELHQSGNVPDITKTPSFDLLRDDSSARVVLYFHGAAGTLASGYRMPSYRAIAALSTPSNPIHILAVDFRGFGSSSGSPSENGLLTDARTLAKFAMETAGVPPERIVLFGQSMGTAIAIRLAHHYTLLPLLEGRLFAGLVLVAPFADVAALTETYSIAGTIPIVAPLARIPGMLALLNRCIVDKWDSKQKIAELIEAYHTMDLLARRYNIRIIHAMDDWDTPWQHSEVLYSHAAYAASQSEARDENTSEQKSVPCHVPDPQVRHQSNLEVRRDLGQGGWQVERQGTRGSIVKQIARYGLHDRVMGYSIVSRAIRSAFGSPGAGSESIASSSA